MVSDTYWKGRVPFHVDGHFAAAEAKVLRDLAAQCDLTTCLDIGCGDPSRGRAILEGYGELTSVDLNPRFAGVEKADVCSFVGGPYGTVLCCRTLCNVAVEQRQAAIHNLARLVAVGGRLLLADGDKTVRDRVKVWRVAAGYDPLPDSSSGSVELRAQDLWELYYAGFRAVKRVYVAPDYLLWTRKAQPKLMSLTDPRRFEHPKYPESDHEAYAWARVWLLKRVEDVA